MSDLSPTTTATATATATTSATTPTRQMPPATMPAPVPSPAQDALPEQEMADEKVLEVQRASRLPVFSRARLLGPVEKDHGDLALLACCLVTGMVDAASFSNWSVFVGMQTGNTVILGLSTAGVRSNPLAWASTLVSIGSFLVGVLATFHGTKFFTPKGITSNRLMASMIFMLQSILILIAAALATPQGLIPQNYDYGPYAGVDILRDPRFISLLPLLAFQSGMQIATSRLLGFNEIPVNVLTSTYCDIMGDFQLLALNNVKRNRRVAAVTLLLCGAIISGWLMRTHGGLWSVLYLAGGIKFLTALGVLFFLPAAK